MSNLTKYKNKGKTWYKGNCGVCNTEFKYQHGIKISRCNNKNCLSHREPFLIEHWMKPKTEVELFVMQRNYQKKLNKKLFEKYALEIKKPEEERNFTIIHRHEKNMDQELLQKMYEKVKIYSASILKKHIKKKNFYLEHEEFLDRVNTMAFIWLEYFIKSPTGIIEKSWGGFLGRKIPEALYKYAKDDSMESLNKLVNDSSGKKTTLLQMEESFHLNFIMNHKSYYDPYEENHLIINEIKKVILLIYKNIINKISYTERVMSLISFNLFLKNEESKLFYLYNEFGNSLKSLNEKLKLQIKKYLKSTIKKN